MIPAIILSVGMPFFPESPRWLIDHGREEEALQILADVHGKGDKENELVRLEYAEIRQQVAFEKAEGAKSYADLFKPTVLRRVGLGASLQMWSQLTGMNIMMCAFTFSFHLKKNLNANLLLYILGTTSSTYSRVPA